MITKITLTGADDSTDIKFLLKTSQEYPLVEWGILVSRDNFGAPRFPSKEWLEQLNKGYKKSEAEIDLSCHLCGRWVRDFCFEGGIGFTADVPIELFKRIQLNFHAITHRIDREKFIGALKIFKWVQFIFQLDDVNNDILKVAQDAGIDAVPLFDTSGGAGVLPELWPASVGYAGYAGGLSPDNLAQQMPEILKASDNKPIWIDAETRLRSEDDKVFEEDKCLEFIKQAYKYI